MNRIIPPYPIPRELPQLQPAPQPSRTILSHSHSCHFRRGNCLYWMSLTAFSPCVPPCLSTTVEWSHWDREQCGHNTALHAEWKKSAIFHIMPPGSLLTLGVCRSGSFRNNPLSRSSYSSISLYICNSMHPLLVPMGKWAKQLIPARLTSFQAQPELELVDGLYRLTKTFSQYGAGRAFPAAVRSLRSAGRRHTSCQDSCDPFLAVPSQALPPACS